MQTKLLSSTEEEEQAVAISHLRVRLGVTAVKARPAWTAVVAGSWQCSCSGRWAGTSMHHTSTARQGVWEGAAGY